jgi:hypothetical protein
MMSVSFVKRDSFGDRPGEAKRGKKGQKGAKRDKKGAKSKNTDIFAFFAPNCPFCFPLFISPS